MYLVSQEGNIKLLKVLPEGPKQAKNAAIFLTLSSDSFSVYLPFNDKTVRDLYSLRQEPGKYGVASKQDHLENILNAILRGAK